MTDANTTPRVQIAPALTEAERQEIFAFRYRIYIDEMGRRGHLVNNSDEPLLYDALDETALLYGAYCDGQLIGTVRGNLVQDFTRDAPRPEWLADVYGLEPFLDRHADGIALTSRLMVAKDQRGTVALGTLVGTAYQVALDRNIEFLFCSCSPALVNMYERLGFRRYIRNVMDPQVGYRVPMVLAVLDQAHLKAVRSPLHRLLQRRDHIDPASAEWFNREFSHAVSHHTLEGNPDSFWEQFSGQIGDDLENAVQILHRLSSEQLMRLAASGVVLRCQSGDTILRENDTGSEMYIIVSGTVHVHRPNSNELIAQLGPGEVVGEIAMLTGATRSAVVTAQEPCELFVFTRQQLDKLMVRAPDLAAQLLFNLSNILCRRLADSNHHRTTRLNRTA